MARNENKLAASRAHNKEKTLPEEESGSIKRGLRQADPQIRDPGDWLPFHRRGSRPTQSTSLAAGFLLRQRFFLAHNSGPHPVPD